MIKAKVNGKSVDIPTSWNDITYRQFIDLFDSKDVYERIGIILKLSPEVARKAKYQGLETIIKTLSFIGQEAQLDENPTKCGGYDFPKDITLESLEQFEVMRNVIKETADKKSPKAHIESLGVYAAIYCQGMTETFNYDKAKAMVKEFDDYPCLEVMSVGNFFMVKVIALDRNLPMNSLMKAIRARRSKRGLRGLMKSLASMRPLTALRDMWGRATKMFYGGT